MGKTELASWVQAIGSLGAILGAIWIWRQQRSVEETKGRKQEVIWNAAVRSDVESVIVHLDTMVGGDSSLSAFSQRDLVNWGMVKRIHAEALADIEGIEARRAGRVDIVESLGELKRKMRSAGIFLAIISDDAKSTPMVDMLEGELRAGLKAARDLKRMLKAD